GPVRRGGQNFRFRLFSVEKNKRGALVEHRDRAGRTRIDDLQGAAHNRRGFQISIEVENAWRLDGCGCFETVRSGGKPDSGAVGDGPWFAVYLGRARPGDSDPISRFDAPFRSDLLDSSYARS